jgi:hypothetical protein
VWLLRQANLKMSFSANGAPSSGSNRIGTATVGAGVGVSAGCVGVAGRRVRVGVGDAVGVGVSVGVAVGVGVRVGEGVELGVGVVVGLLVGVGVIDGVSEGVSVGTSTRTGTSLATACTVPSASDGRNLSSSRSSPGPMSATNAAAMTKMQAINTGHSQSSRNDSPQLGQTCKPRLLTAPQCRQRTRRGRRWGLPQWGQTS